MNFKLILTIDFMIALSTSIYFFGKLLTWSLYKLKPENFKKKFTENDITKSVFVMICSILLWGLLFYNLI